MGKAAVVLGSIGLIVAFVVGIIGPSARPTRILFWVAGLLTFVALVLGLVGPWRAKRGRATNLQQPLTGALLAGLAMAWYINGVVTTTDVFHEASCKVAPAAGALEFNTSRCYADGMQVTVSAPKPFSVPESASGHTPGNRAVSVDITFRNGSVGVLDLELPSCGANDADGRQANPIFHGDEHDGVKTLLPGMKKVWHCEFSLPPSAASSMTGMVSPGIGHGEEASWSGPVPRTRLT
ncbi:hypothetical protein [Streptomyces sioyaensis]|uniref:hypothetical protein n=1 Tax=Streptomyces sioyaensis TaxID=67364 RepID=UPI003D70A12B